jgi:hypothetical protein
MNPWHFGEKEINREKHCIKQRRKLDHETFKNDPDWANDEENRRRAIEFLEGMDLCHRG